MFSNSLVSFERFAPCSPILYSLSSSLLPVLLKFPSHFRAVCALFSNSLVSFERFAPCSQTLYSLSIGLLPRFEQFAPRKFSSLFRAACSFYSLPSSLLLVLTFLVPFEQFAPCSQIERAVCSLFSDSLVPFGQFAPCSQILYTISSGLLLVLKISTRFPPCS